MKRVIQHKGYVVTGYALRQTRLWSGLKPVFVTRHWGERCDFALFFLHGTYLGRDSKHCHLYPEVSWGGGREVALVYPQYRKQDPTCCPTLDPDLVRFRWNDGRLQRIP